MRGNITYFFSILLFLVVTPAQGRQWPDDGQDAQRIDEILSYQPNEEELSAGREVDPGEPIVVLATKTPNTRRTRDRGVRIRRDPLDIRRYSTAANNRREIAINDLPKFINNSVLKVTTRSGANYTAKLISINEDSIDLEVVMSGGMASINLKKSNLVSVRRAL